jgi:hypothetical protein
MRRTPVVLGVLSIVFGAVQLLYTLFGLVIKSYQRELNQLGKALGQGATAPALYDALTQAGEKIKLWGYLHGALYIVAAGALIAVGGGLYRRQRWARPAALVWSAAALGLLAFTLWVQLAITLPLMQEAVAGLSNPLVDLIWQWQKVVIPVVMVVMYTPFPVLLGILMGRPSAARDLHP